MISFFAQHTTLRKFTASLVLFGFSILNMFTLAVAFAPVAHAEGEAGWEPDISVSLTGAEMVDNVYPGPDEFSWFISIQHPHPTVVLQWRVVLSRNIQPDQYHYYNCKLYGSIVPRDLPPLTSDYNTGTIVVNDAQLGTYDLMCGTTGRAEAFVYHPYETRRVPWCPTIFGTGTQTNGINLFHYEEYYPRELKAPAENNNVSLLSDWGEKCLVGGGLEEWDIAPWNNLNVPPWSGDNEIGWPGLMVHSEREITAHYKNAETVSVCTKATVTATRYRVGLIANQEVLPNDESIHTVHYPYGISHEAPVTKVDEKCVDRLANDDIIASSRPICTTVEHLGFFELSYDYSCNTNAMAARGEISVCHWQKTVSGISPILSIFITAVLMVGGAIITIIISPFVTLASQVAAVVSNILGFSLGIAAGRVLGIKSAPQEDIGTCSWSQGLAAETSTEPTCTNCGFNPTSITRGDKTTVSWNLSPAVSRADLACDGDIAGGFASVKIPADAPYSGTADLYPQKTQSCTLTVFNSAGVKRDYSGPPFHVDVTPPHQASEPPPPPPPQTPPPPQPPPLSNDAACLGMTASSTVTAGQKFSGSVTMQNTGTKQWVYTPPTTDTGDYVVDPVSSPGTYSTFWGGQGVVLPLPTVNPGKSAEFNFSATAPATIGTYNLEWQMFQQNIEFFGTTCKKNITVIPAPPPGTVRLHATVDYQPVSATITADFGVSPDGSYPNSAVTLPLDVPNVPPVTITTTYRSISPPYDARTFVNITRADNSVCADGGNTAQCTQTLLPEGDVTFTYNFVSPP